MAKLIYGTCFVEESEPCLGLFEMNLQSPGNRGWHRYQILYVMRGDSPSEFRKDMGLARKFKANQFRIPGGAWDEITDRYYVEHTVGELVEMANDMREFPSFDLKELVLGTRKLIVR